MICINDKQYNGHISQNDDKKLVVIVNTAEMMQELLANLTNVSKVVETIGNEKEEIVVQYTTHVKTIETGLYLIEFSKELPYNQQMELKIKAQTEVIDKLLVMLLEG